MTLEGPQRSYRLPPRTFPRGIFEPRVSDLRSKAVKITHEGVTPEPAHNYLSATDAAKILVQGIFNSESRWVYPRSDLKPYEGHLERVINEMLKYVEPIYDAAQSSIARVNWFGYNDHGPLHIQRVVERAFSICKLGKFTPEETRRTLIAAALHDLGNLVNRDIHGFLSPRIATAIFPHLLDDHKQWRMIRRAIRLHDIAGAKNIIAGMSKLTFEDRLSALDRVFGPEGMALFIADKLQFTRERINLKARENPQSIQEHSYSAVNLFLETQSYTINSKQQIEWRIKFRPDIQESEMETLGNLSEASEQHRSGRKCTTPAVFEELWKRANVPYFDTSIRLFWSTSSTVVFNAIEKSLALFNGTGRRPKVQAVILHFEDPGARSFMAQERSFTFTRERFSTNRGKIEDQFLGSRRLNFHKRQ